MHSMFGVSVRELHVYLGYMISKKAFESQCVIANESCPCSCTDEGCCLLYYGDSSSPEISMQDDRFHAPHLTRQAFLNCSNPKVASNDETA